MKVKTQVANVTANAANFLVNWRPFNHRPFTSIYDWAHKVRSSDPAWIEFMERQDAEIIEKAMEAAAVKMHDNIVQMEDAAKTDRREIINGVKTGKIRRIVRWTWSLVRKNGNSVATGLETANQVG